MKWKTRLCVLLAVIALGTVFCPSAAAGGEKAAAAEETNAFYRQNAAACTADGRRYLLNGQAGYVQVYAEPGLTEAAGCLSNEAAVTVRFTWQDEKGRVWALCSESSGSGVWAEDRESGWVPMSDLVLCYDKEQFVAEHFEEFIMEPVSLDMRDYETVYLWPYPGSGGRAALATWYVRTEQDNVLEFPAYWVDSLGRRWGGYHFIDADGFVCLDEPGLEENTLPEVRNASLIPAAASLPRIAAAEADKPVWIYWAAIAAAVSAALAVGALSLYRKRKKDGKRKTQT